MYITEDLWLKTRNPIWRLLWAFWSKIFAINFGMGVVSGLVMAYPFGTNWSGFSQFAGSITGPLLTYEVLTAFFLEAGFPGVMLFGWNKAAKALQQNTIVQVLPAYRLPDRFLCALFPDARFIPQRMRRVIEVIEAQ